MRQLLITTAILFVVTTTAHAGLIEFHGGEFTSIIRTNIAPAITQTTAIGQSHRGPLYSTTQRLGRASVSVGVRSDEDYGSLVTYTDLESTWKLFAGEIVRTNEMNLDGWYEFTTSRELELYWRNSLPGPTFVLNGEPIEFERVPLTEHAEYFAMLPAGRHRIELSAGPMMHLDALSLFILTIPEPSSLVLLVVTIAAAGCWRWRA